MYRRERSPVAKEPEREAEPDEDTEDLRTKVKKMEEEVQNVSCSSWFPVPGKSIHIGIVTFVLTQSLSLSTVPLRNSKLLQIFHKCAIICNCC